RRHHTFFEMMGNFSIGDYFKEDAISMAYELLTSSKWFNIPVEKLYVTVFTNDYDAKRLWLNEGILEDHIIPLDDNFWEIGPGPCGPDSEIFFDRGEKYDPEGDALEKFKRGDDNERYIEIWNNVFSQFNCEENKKREEYKELPSKNIDTGAGLERWACIFQDADSNFDTDLFMPIIKQIEDLSGTMYNGEMPFKVIADHIRTLTFALADGAVFENVGRGYILRRLLRRSVRYGRKLSLNETFMYKLVDSVIDNMVDVYPYLEEKRELIKILIKQEEELFSKTLNQGEKKLYELMDESLDNTISGVDAFKLYDTYGFPIELTLEYLEEKGFTTDRQEFDKYMEQQKKLSKNSQKHETSMNSQNELLLKYNKKSEFLYETYKCNSKIIDLIANDKIVDTFAKEGYVVFDKTCFYATSGGQVNDTGMIISSEFKARVLDVFKAPNGQHIHKIKILSGKIANGLDVELIVDYQRRLEIEANHSSVHLLQYALRHLISSDIHQAGSYVDNEKLRFDFNYIGKITDEELIKVEELVNKMIKEGIERKTEIKNINEIDKSEVMALFSEKYGDKVRLVEIGPSKELCGGTHVKNTKDIKKLAILSLINKGSNTYRIEAATNERIEEALLDTCKPYNDEIVKLLLKAKNLMQDAKAHDIKLTFSYKNHDDNFTSYEDICKLRNNLANLQEEIKELEKKYQKLKEEKAISNIEDFTDDIEVYNKTNLLLKETSNMDINTLKQIMDNLANEYSDIFIMIVNKNKDSINILSRSNSKFHAGNLLKDAAALADGRGGGSEKFAQGAIKDSKKIKEIFAMIRKYIEDNNA
ncbi:MAG: alanine--tRNA ligase, partial [Bacilli bacterium]|nr:alanine--tRNA ligase [Bacilli bacterium]